MASQRATSCKLHTSSHRTGLKFDPYTYLLFHGLYTEDGVVRRGTEGEARSASVQIPALATPVPKNCCGQLRNP
jgi:hypothetical protein